MRSPCGPTVHGPFSPKSATWRWGVRWSDPARVGEQVIEGERMGEGEREGEAGSGEHGEGGHGHRRERGRAGGRGRGKGRENAGEGGPTSLEQPGPPVIQRTTGSFLGSFRDSKNQ